MDFGRKVCMSRSGISDIKYIYELKLGDNGCDGF